MVKCPLKKTISLLLVFVLLSGLNIQTAFAEETQQAEPPPSETVSEAGTKNLQAAAEGCYTICTKDHATGVKLPSEEQMKRFEAQAEKAVKVLPNELGLQRINESRAKNNLSPLQEAKAQQGDGIVTSKNKANLVQAGELFTAGLPETVDNSTLKYFPEIGDQGMLGSCAAFATAYYAATYTIAQARGWDVKAEGTAKTISPKWAYNLTNGGRDSGCWPGDIASVMQNNGALTWDEFPYDDNYLEWPVDALKWRSALKYCLAGTGYIKDINTPDGLANLKSALNNGKVVVMMTDSIYGWMGNAIKDNPNTTLDDGEIGKWGAYYMHDWGGRHALTIVGYNDTIWMDRNADDVMQPEELGAFKVANSWGTSWGDNGFTWFTYAAINDTPETTGFASITKYNMVFYLEASASDYKPLLTAEINLTTSNRGRLEYYYGLNHKEASTPDANPSFGYLGSSNGYFIQADFQWPFFNYGGAYSFAGTTDARPGTILLNLTDNVSGKGFGMRHDWRTEGGLLSYCMGVRDTALDGAPAVVNSIIFENWKTGERVNASELTPTATFDRDMKWYSAVNALNPEIPAKTPDPSVGSLPQVTENVAASGSSTGVADVKMWRFTPQRTGTYLLKSYNERIKYEIANSAGQTLYTGKIFGQTTIRAALNAGETYIIKACLFMLGEGLPNPPVFAFDFTISGIDPVKSADAFFIYTADRNFMLTPLSPAFQKDAGSYTVYVAQGENSVRIYPMPESERARITIDGEDTGEKEIVLNTGESKNISVKITSCDGSAVREYNINVINAVRYKVTFVNPWGGSYLPKVWACAGAKITPPVITGPKGHKFLGWFCQDLGRFWNFETDTVTKDTLLGGIWDHIDVYKVKAAPNNKKYGTVTGAGNYYPGVTVSLTAIPKNGYRFICWQEGSKKLSSNYNLQFLVSKNRAFKAVFAAIGAPSVTVKPSGGGVNIAWKPVAGAAGYEVYRASSPKGQYQKIAATGSSNFADTDLNTGMYYYKVRAYCTTGAVTTFGKFSAVKSAAIPPPAPSGLEAVASVNSVDLNWNPSAGAYKYEIWRSNKQTGGYKMVASAASAAFINTGLKKGRTYYYKIRCYCLCGKTKIYSGYSGIAFAFFAG